MTTITELIELRAAYKAREAELAALDTVYDFDPKLINLSTAITEVLDRLSDPVPADWEGAYLEHSKRLHAERKTVPTLKVAFEAGMVFERTHAKPAPVPLTWDDMRNLSDIPSVDEAFRGLIDDPTEDGAVIAVREVLRAADVPVDGYQPIAEREKAPVLYFGGFTDRAEAVEALRYGIGGPRDGAEQLFSEIERYGRECAAFARWHALPVPMVLHCPKCGMQHVDAPDDDIPGVVIRDGRPVIVPCVVKANDPNAWTNPPHRSHKCGSCGTIWRPADIATTGVERIETKGKADTWAPGDVSKPLLSPSEGLGSLVSWLGYMGQHAVDEADRTACAAWANELRAALRPAPEAFDHDDRLSADQLHVELLKPGTKCKGRNYEAVDGVGHSRECVVQHEVTTELAAAMDAPSRTPSRTEIALRILCALMAMPNEWRAWAAADGKGTTWRQEALRVAFQLADEFLRAAQDKPLDWSPWVEVKEGQTVSFDWSPDGKLAEYEWLLKNANVGWGEDGKYCTVAVSFLFKYENEPLKGGLRGAIQRAMKS